jgi:squalene-hopene/tetraprenyl-beta-curcumene cyclase
MNPERLVAALKKATGRLLDLRMPGGCWEGRLSSSALSTATAISALSIAAQSGDAARISAGIAWLTKTQNADGGWGDTPDSPSNLSTSLLVAAALKLTSRSSNLVGPLPAGGERLSMGSEPGTAGVPARLETYLNHVAGSSEAQRRESVCAAYAPDRTFAVPILTNLALAGAASWDGIPPLPYELAALPPGLFRFLRLHVVSYALPALIAVGLTLEHHQPPCFVLRRWLRAAARGKALRKLEEIQPSSGGFLEAVPLTSFVTMSLLPLYGHTHPVARKGLEFLRAAAREDGSWPIDTNLSVWVTTAAVAALSETAMGDTSIPAPRSPLLAPSPRSWLLAAQHVQRHPYTDSAPGGWAWTDLPGGVPDADDTAGAILALTKLGESGPAIETGVRWLLDLQNSDGGWPTFCRGWGHLPFDRSAPDLTAHVLRALKVFAPAGKHPEVQPAIRRGVGYLHGQQRADGSWRPLWFGNQAAGDHANPVLGTARVLRALGEWEPASEAARRGIHFLLKVQNPDGGWGGEAGVASTTEETSLAISALASWHRESTVCTALERGVLNLVERVESDAWLKPASIGLYFARLWYSEEAYPVIWTVEALGRVWARNEERVAESE